MGNKTRLEKEITAYNGFQHTIRQMTESEREQYADPQSPEGRRYAKRVAARRELIGERKREIAEFDKGRPDLDILDWRTPEGIERSRAIKTKWDRDRKAFMEDLDARLPLD